MVGSGNVQEEEGLQDHWVVYYRVELCCAVLCCVVGINSLFAAVHYPSNYLSSVLSALSKILFL